KEKTEPEFLIEVSGDSAGALSYSRGELFRACSIYILIFLFILLCSPLFPTVKSAVSQVASSLSFPLTDGNNLSMTLEWIATPGVLIIIASVIGGLIQKASLSCLLNVFVSTVKQLKNSIIAISAIVAMATVMDICGLIGTLAQSLVDLTGGAYLFIAPVIGAV
ncbi:L-lactate permease, partial [Escherichia coli]|uniref:L-lactate permease n=1 Tax=Escherichia coli TaxID=562 RepID=UPI002245DFC8